MEPGFGIGDSGLAKAGCFLTNPESPIPNPGF